MLTDPCLPPTHQSGYYCTPFTGGKSRPGEGNGNLPNSAHLGVKRSHSHLGRGGGRRVWGQGRPHREPDTAVDLGSQTRVPERTSKAPGLRLQDACWATVGRDRGLRDSVVGHPVQGSFIRTTVGVATTGERLQQGTETGPSSGCSTDRQAGIYSQGMGWGQEMEHY